MKYALAELLLRRKELDGKVREVTGFKVADVFEMRVKRVKVADGIDKVVANVPKLSLKEVTAEHDFYARQLRMVDALIQRTNWETEVTSTGDLMADFE